jgi:hypothetical protein
MTIEKLREGSLKALREFGGVSNTRPTTDDFSFWLRSYTAYCEGVKSDDPNPYKPDSLEYKIWERGFQDEYDPVHPDFVTANFKLLDVTIALQEVNNILFNIPNQRAAIAAPSVRLANEIIGTSPQHRTGRLSWSNGSLLISGSVQSGNWVRGCDLNAIYLHLWDVNKQFDQEQFLLDITPIISMMPNRTNCFYSIDSQK